MTKRSARKLIREGIDALNARHDEQPEVTSSAQRAFGRAHRQLADAGISLTDDECLELMAYAHGYVHATTGVDEPRPVSWAQEIDERTEAYAAGARAPARTKRP